MTLRRRFASIFRLLFASTATEESFDDGGCINMSSVFVSIVIELTSTGLWPGVETLLIFEIMLCTSLIMRKISEEGIMRRSGPCRNRTYNPLIKSQML